MNKSLTQINSDSFKNQTLQCCFELHKCSALALIRIIFNGKTDRSENVNLNLSQALLTCLLN